MVWQDEKEPLAARQGEIDRPGGIMHGPGANYCVV
jgi:hypothetical protein